MDEKNLIWEMDLNVLEEFYQRCIDKNAETEEDKIKVLTELATEGKMNRVVETARSKEQIVSDLKKNFNVATIDQLLENGEIDEVN